jgi:hypothetical protein
MVAQSQAGTSNRSLRWAALTPRIRYLSMSSHSAHRSARPTTSATVTLSRASRPPRITQHSPYTAAVSDRLSAIPAW